MRAEHELVQRRKLSLSTQQRRLRHPAHRNQHPIPAAPV